MKTAMSFVSTGFLATAMGCASSPPPTLQSGLGAEVTIDGLYRVENSRVTVAYMKPDVDLARYNRFIIDPVYVAYQRDPGGRTRSTSVGGGEDNYELAPSQMETLKSIFHEEVVRALTQNDGYDIVTEPGPDVLRIEASLLDLVVRVPTRREGRTDMFVRSYGLVSVVVEVRDSESGEILGRAGERPPVFIRSDVTRMFRHWASLLRQRFDELRAEATTN